MRTLAFDLDDTLYKESDYVKSGLSHVARHFAPRLRTTESELGALFDHLFHSAGRDRIFDRALAALETAYDAVLIDAMVNCYRQQQPEIALYAGVDELLQQLRAAYRLVLVTDGLPLMQRNKVAALQLEHRFDEVIYCWEHNAPKPDSTGYRLAIGEGLRKAIIVGDHPINDGQPARELGVPFIRVMSERFADDAGGDVVVQSVVELPEVLGDV